MVFASDLGVLPKERRCFVRRSVGARSETALKSQMRAIGGGNAGCSRIPFSLRSRGTVVRTAENEGRIVEVLCTRPAIVLPNMAQAKPMSLQQLLAGCLCTGRAIPAAQSAICEPP